MCKSYLILFDKVRHVVDVFPAHINFKFAGEGVIDQTGDAREFQPTRLCPIFQFNGTDQFLIGMRSPREEAQNVFPADDGK